MALESENGDVDLHNDDTFGDGAVGAYNQIQSNKYYNNQI